MMATAKKAYSLSEMRVLLEMMVLLTVMEKLVNIGQSVQIKGELTGNEDLTIDGKVDGSL